MNEVERRHTLTRSHTFLRTHWRTYLTHLDEALPLARRQQHTVLLECLPQRVDRDHEEPALDLDQSRSTAHRAVTPAAAAAAAAAVAAVTVAAAAAAAAAAQF